MQTLFVFYNPKAADWEYGEFPSGWWWVTSAIGEAKKYYRREEQFTGPKESLNDMLKYLEDYFNQLVEKGIIESYYISDKYINL